MTKHTWLLVLIAAGCVDAGDEATETTAEEIRGGIETAEPGVVGMFIGGGFCTASLIADDTLITAASCQSGTADPQMIKVLELEASGRYRCLTATTDVLGAADAHIGTVAALPGCIFMPARFLRGTNTSVDNDFMVMRLVSNRWWGKNRGEHVRLLTQSTLEATNGLHTTTPDDFYMGFGASGAQMGVPRTRSAIWEVEDDELHYMNLEATDAQGVCVGDGGGPIGFHNLGDPVGLVHRYAVAGVLTRSDLGPTGCVEDDGDNQNWTRISSYLYLMQNLLGRTCRAYQSQAPGDLMVNFADCDNSIACVGETPDGSTAWQVETANSVSVTINTAACGYGTTPLYFPTLLGTTHHWRAMGTTSVFQATATGFKVVVTDRAGAVSPTDANARHWRIGWQAVRPSEANPSGCTGKTTPGSTAWQTNAGPGGGIFVDINTSVCAFPTAPTYIASLGGNALHHRTTGISSAYNATATGFRVFIHGQDGVVPTPAMANANQWHVNWLGKEPAASTEYCAGSTPTTGWIQNGPNGLTRTIDISSCGLTVTPRILASLGGSTMHWNTTGATSLYNITPTSFQVFVYDESGAVTPGMAIDRGWHIDFAVRR